jgi:hypothetical protein
MSRLNSTDWAQSGGMSNSIARQYEFGPLDAIKATLAGAAKQLNRVSREVPSCFGHWIALKAFETVRPGMRRAVDSLTLTINYFA